MHSHPLLLGSSLATPFLFQAGWLLLWLCTRPNNYPYGRLQLNIMSVQVMLLSPGHSPWRPPGEGGGGALAIVCVLGMCRPQGYVFHGFCLGRVLFSGPTVWQEVCFDSGLTHTEILTRVVIWPFFFWEGWEVFVWEGKGYATPGCKPLSII